VRDLERAATSACAGLFNPEAYAALARVRQLRLLGVRPGDELPSALRLRGIAERRAEIRALKEIGHATEAKQFAISGLMEGEQPLEGREPPRASMMTPVPQRQATAEELPCITSPETPRR
jgi:hypothetical protein